VGTKQKKGAQRLIEVNRIVGKRYGEKDRTEAERGFKLKFRGKSEENGDRDEGRETKEKRYWR